MRFDSLSADPFGHRDLAVKNAAARAAVMLAFAAGLLVGALGAWAGDEPARPRPTVERAGTDIVRFQPTAEQLAPPNQPDISASEGQFIDQLYRQLIGPPPATSSSSRPRPAPNGDAAGSVRRWGPR
jgi:hypothetical protein